MRVVIYSDEDLEPITVLNLPLTERDLSARGYRWRVPVPEPFEFDHFATPAPTQMRVVDLWFEPFARNSHGREQRTWMCFTKADDLAMLLNPAWLPGQRTAIRYLEDQNDALTNMLMRVLS